MRIKQPKQPATSMQQDAPHGPHMVQAAGRQDSAFVDSRPMVAAQRKRQMMMDGSPHATQLKALSAIMNQRQAMPVPSTALQMAGNPALNADAGRAAKAQAPHGAHAGTVLQVNKGVSSNIPTSRCKFQSWWPGHSRRLTPTQ